MSAPKVVQVTVYDAPTVASDSSGCGCGCGHHDHDHQEAGDPLEKISMEMRVRALALTLEEDFPGQVKVEYLNVLQDPRAQGLPQTSLLCSLTYPTPMVYIDGQGRFAGDLPVERIREEVAKVLEAV